MLAGPARALKILIAVFILSLCAGCGASDPTRPYTVITSPGCYCHFSYPSSWFFQAANGDSSLPLLNLTTSDPVSSHHVPVPPNYAAIGISWTLDPSGQLFNESTTMQQQGFTSTTMTVSGFPAASFTSTIRAYGYGETMQRHVYIYVAPLQRDYDISLIYDASIPKNAALRQPVFDYFLHSLSIGIGQG